MMTSWTSQEVMKRKSLPPDRDQDPELQPLRNQRYMKWMKAPTLQDQISLIRSLERTSAPQNQRTSQDPRSPRLREPGPRSSPLTTRSRRFSPLTPTKMSSISRTQMVKV